MNVDQRKIESKSKQKRVICLPHTILWLEGLAWLKCLASGFCCCTSPWKARICFWITSLGRTDWKELQSDCGLTESNAFCLNSERWFTRGTYCVLWCIENIYSISQKYEHLLFADLECLHQIHSNMDRTCIKIFVLCKAQGTKMDHRSVLKSWGDTMQINGRIYFVKILKSCSQ